MSIIWRAQVPIVKDNPSPGAVSQPMTFKAIPLLLLLPAVMLVPVACGDTPQPTPAP
jgi:hypothetical protein